MAKFDPLAAGGAVLLAIAASNSPAAAQSADADVMTRPVDGAIVPPAETLEQLRARAESGDRGAQLDLGGRLLDSRDPADAVEARRWFQRGADAGDPESKNGLATMLLFGLGGPPDLERGRRLMEEAAREGSVGANLSIALRYSRGADGYPRDPARAFAHTSAAAAAERSNGRGSFAQWQLAMMHVEGNGTPRNPQEAFRLLAPLSEAGSVRAMISRAVMLATGDGVAKDPAAARTWYQRAAESREHGFEHGLRGIGGMLVVGEGGSVDLPRGIAYLRIAEAAGDKIAAEILSATADRVTPEIDREARRVAGEWMERYLPRQ
jgi:TPR repeat protein